MAPSSSKAQMKVSVNVCTFKRPDGLAKLLDSLAAQRFEKHPGTVVVVNVVDNEPNPEIQGICEAVATRGLLVRYLEEPRRGIAHARNKGLDAVEPDSDFIAILDDDEEADPSWLDELIEAAVQTGAVSICGTVQPQLPEEAPAWMHSRCWFHRPFRVQRARGEEIPTHYIPLLKGTTANLLLRRSFVQKHALRFDARFNNGSDAVLIRAILHHGGKLFYAPAAIVTEIVPANRCRLSYILKRGFASGTVRWRIENSYRPRRQGWSVQAKMRAKFLRKALKRCLVQSVRAIGLVCILEVRDGRLIESIYTICISVGGILGVFGWRHRLY